MPTKCFSYVPWNGGLYASPDFAPPGNRPDNIPCTRRLKKICFTGDPQKNRLHGLDLVICGPSRAPLNVSLALAYKPHDHQPVPWTQLCCKLVEAGGVPVKGLGLSL